MIAFFILLLDFLCSAPPGHAFQMLFYRLDHSKNFPNGTSILVKLFNTLFLYSEELSKVIAWNLQFYNLFFKVLFHVTQNIKNLS